MMDVLPAELIRQCLVRVPYTSHPNLAAVCRSWWTMVKSPQFYEDRKKFGTSQHCICLSEGRILPIRFMRFWISVHDPVQGTWEEFRQLPRLDIHRGVIPLVCHCVCVNRKLLFIGGTNAEADEKMYTVFIYDLLSAKWSRGTDIPLRATLTSCSVSPEGLVYVAGGINVESRKSELGAAVYNVEKDEWKLLADMNRESGDLVGWGAFIDGKFFVIYGLDIMRDRVSAQVYDPEKGTWATLPDMHLTFSHGHACVSSEGKLYWFEQGEGGVKVYDSRENVWRSLGSLPQTLESIRCCAPWRDGIFVCGYMAPPQIGHAYLEPSGYVDPYKIGDADFVFYMWKPPRIIDELSQDQVAGEWTVIPIQSPLHTHADMDCFRFRGAVTFEI